MAVVLVTEEAIPPVYRFSLTEKLAIELADRGVKVHLVCRKGEGEFQHYGVTCHPVHVKDWSLFNLKKRAEANLSLVFKIWEVMRKDDIKLVYGWWPVLFFSRIAGSPVAADMPEFIDVMYRSFNKPLHFLLSPLLRFFQRTVATMSRVVITESDMARAVWASRGIDYKKTCSIPYGVDVNHFISVEKDRDFRKRFEISEEELLIMYHGDIGIDDGVDLLIEATEGLDARVVIIGEGDPGYMRHLRKIAHSRVIFTGWIPYKQIPGILKNADLYVAPFRSSLYTNTTYPLKIMEAMAAALPVVVSHLQALSLYLRDGKDSVFFKPSDIDDMRTKIIYLLKDEGQRRQLGQEALRTAQKYFDYRLRIKRESDLLLGLL